VGHSTGGGEVVRCLARHGEKRASKACLIAAVPPLMVKTASNRGGLPKDVFDGLLLKNGTLKTYKGFPHSMPTTQADVINADLLAFIKA
jgi:hypothetical protein